MQNTFRGQAVVRGLISFSALTLVGAATTATATAAPAGARTTSSHHVSSDFDGDGRADLAIGEPGSGKVIIRLTSAGGATHTQVLTAPNATAHDAFGQSLAVSDFNGDGYADLAVGAPGYQSASAEGEGQGEVVVFDGSATGLEYATKIIGPSDFDDSSGFGASLAAADTNGDGKADLVVGNPDRGDGDSPDGVVSLYLGSAAGLKTTSASTWESAMDECGCAFGRSVALGDLNGDGHIDLAIGTPGYGFTKGQHAGSVAIVDGRSAGLAGASITEVLKGVSAGVKANFSDFGSSVAIGTVDAGKAGELAVGAPGATVSGKASAGKVAVFRGRTGGPSTSDVYSFTAASPGVAGSPAKNAFFGSALSLRDLTGDNRADLVIGVPGATIAGFAHAGAIEVLRSIGGTLSSSGSQRFTEATSGVPGAVRKNDQFGVSLYEFSATPKGAPELAVGASGALGGSTRSGTVTVFHTNKAGLKVSGIKLLHDATAAASAAFGLSIR